MPARACSRPSSEHPSAVGFLEDQGITGDAELWQLAPADRRLDLSELEHVVRAQQLLPDPQDVSLEVGIVPAQAEDLTGDGAEVLLSGQARRTGKDSRPFIKLTGRQRSSGGGTASDIRGKRASRAPMATSASIRASGAPRQWCTP